MKPQTDLTTNFLLVNFPLSIPHTATKQSGTGTRGLDSVSEEASPISSSAMRNPPGRHLLKVASRAVRSSSGASGLGGGGGGASTSASSPVSASSGGRPRGGGRLLRATSPPPPSAIAAAACWDSRNLRRDGEDDWEEVVATGEEPAPGASEAEEDNEYRVVFWSPPTGDEVRSAFSSIQEVFENSYGAADSDETEKQLALLSTSVHSSSSNSSGSDDWVEPAAYVLNSTAFLTREHRGVLDAFRLLQRDPNVQKMVMSLSCDKAVWNAVMNNEAVQEFRRSFQDAKEIGRKGNPGGPAAVLKWILGKTQAKIMEFFDNVMKIVSMLFNPQSDEEKPDMYSEAVKVSFMLSVFVFIVVAIARINYEPWDFKVW
ncbi:uncharacterized protein LOC100822545 [Brachypodium distachyon]|uniref:Uncharacterized protein n=1 Tax=Brachypodium distachyon TaxID=15368 RepID=A0A0Q3QFT0_BRADI|nr:uncharacterized protein LOC100822545 [Brachypodium distachyon]KQK00610.1 hypothetical protein BRADI_3g50647v3 [Brachypodium distachyon]|eukprot:XP_003570024.2 uncharacterized protein LOC100822545 [Brachypodium distachyon]